MAIMGFTVKNISRARGSSAVASAAYIGRTKLRDERLHRSFDHTARGGLEHSEILLPEKAPSAADAWARDRAKLWNAAEKAEARPNARVAREYVVPLPHELTAEQRLELARGFAQSVADRYGVAADLAIHTAPPGGDARNHHAHVLTTTRVIEAEGLGRKTNLALNDTMRRERGLRSGSEEIRQLRIGWAARVNEHLRDAGLDLSVDPRSYWERGSTQVPQQHFGPRLMALERAGIATEAGARLREEHAARTQMMQEFAAATAATWQHAAGATPEVAAQEKPAAEAGRACSQTAAKATSLEETLSIDERQRRAAERWLAYRQELEAGRQATPRAARTKDHDHGADLEL